MSGIYHKNKEWANVTEINKTGATATDTLKKVTVNGTTYGVESVYAKISSLAAHATVPLDNTTLKIGSDGSDSAVYSTCTKSTYYPSTSTLSLATKTDFNLTQLQDVFIPQIDIDEKTDTAPYIYRPSVANGDRVSEDIVGASVGWNQLVQNGNFASNDGWSVSNGTLSVSGSVATVTANGSSGRVQFYRSVTPKIQGHKILVSFECQCSENKSLNVNWGSTLKNVSLTTAKQKFYFVAEVGSGNENLNFSADPSSAGVTFKYSNVWITDLTLDFGATIADHIYSLEQATAGSGIAWLKSYGFLTKSYYPYNAGELLSVEVEGKKYVGFNQWDEEWESGTYSSTGEPQSNANYIRSKNTSPIPMFPNTTYYLKSNSGIFINFFDKNGIFTRQVTWQKNTTLTTNSNEYFSKFVVATQMQTYNHDICINISKTTGTPKNGDYLPYEERTYTFPSQTLRGLFTLVDGELKAVGDVYGDSGVIKRKFKRYNMGGIEWGFSSTDQVFWTLGIESTKNLIACGYVFKDISDVTNNATAAQYLGNLECTYRHGSTNDRVYFKNSAYTDKTSFVAAMNGVYMDIELPTPTTEQAEPLIMPQICDKNGTEEFVTTSIVPVGHESTYYNYPDYMETGEYKNFRDRVDYATEKAKWHQVGIYANGDTITIDGYYNEIMLVPNHYSGTTLLACASPAIFPFSLFKSITLQNSTESERIDITPAGVVGVTGTYFSNVTVFVR